MNIPITLYRYIFFLKVVETLPPSGIYKQRSQCMEKESRSIRRKWFGKDKMKKKNTQKKSKDWKCGRKVDTYDHHFISISKNCIWIPSWIIPPSSRCVWGQLLSLPGFRWVWLKQVTKTFSLYMDNQEVTTKVIVFMIYLSFFYFELLIRMENTR